MILDLLVVNKADYFPSILKNDPFITECFFMYSIHANNPYKLNVKIIAKAICHFNEIVKKVGKTVLPVP